MKNASCSVRVTEPLVIAANRRLNPTASALSRPTCGGFFLPTVLFIVQIERRNNLKEGDSPDQPLAMRTCLTLCSDGLTLRQSEVTLV